MKLYTSCLVFPPVIPTQGSGHVSQTRCPKQAAARLISTANSFSPVVLGVCCAPLGLSPILGLLCPALPQSPGVLLLTFQGSRDLLPGSPRGAPLHFVPISSRVGLSAWGLQRNGAWSQSHLCGSKNSTSPKPQGDRPPWPCPTLSLPTCIFWSEFAHWSPSSPGTPYRPPKSMSNISGCPQPPSHYSFC